MSQPSNKLFAILAILVLITLGSCVGYGQGLPGTTVPSGFGVAIHTSSPSATELNLFGQCGFGFARTDMNWNTVEKTVGVYDFSAYTNALATFAAKNCRVMFILAYGNTLYNGGKPPTSLSDQQAYANFAGKAAAYFKGQGVIWELWNEPNSQNANWKLSPDAYTSMAILAAQAIHTADPAAIVIAPALSKFGWQFINQCFKDGLLHYIDAVSIHPYRPSYPETAQADIARLRQLIGVWTAAGDPQRAIVCSEWGYTTSTSANGVALDQQARYLTREWLSNLSVGVNLSIWYDWKNDGPNAADDESNFGTVTNALVPKTAYNSAQSLIAFLRNYQYCHRIPGATASDYRLLFKSGGSMATVSWSSDPTATTTAQTPALHSVAVSDSDYATLHRISQIDYTSAVLVTTPSPWAQLPVTFTNTDTTSANISMVVGGQIKTATLAAGAQTTVTFSFPPSLITSNHSVTMPVTCTWNGASVNSLPAVTMVTAYPLAISASVIGNGYALNAVIDNTLSTPFSGTIQFQNSGNTYSFGTWIGGKTSKTIGCSLATGQPTIISLIDANGITQAKLGPVTFQSLSGWPTTVGGTGPWDVVRGFSNGTASIFTPVSAVATASGSPASVAVSVSIQAQTGWAYSILWPTTTNAIPTNANALTAWVYENANGVALASRYNDTTAQTFQPNLPITVGLTGWQPITITFDGQSFYYGGAKDGIAHNPFIWNSLLLFNGSTASTATGQLLVAAPYLAIGEPAEPGVPNE